MQALFSSVSLGLPCAATTQGVRARARVAGSARSKGTLRSRSSHSTPLDAATPRAAYGLGCQTLACGAHFS